MKRLYFSLFLLLTLLMLCRRPVFYAYAAWPINYDYYISCFEYVESEGFVQREGYKIILGDIESNTSSSLVYRVKTTVLPFLTDIMRSVTTPYVIFKSAQVTAKGEFDASASKRIISLNQFPIESWRLYDYSKARKYDIKQEREALAIFVEGESGGYVAYGLNQLAIQTNRTLAMDAIIRGSPNSYFNFILVVKGELFPLYPKPVSLGEDAKRVVFTLPGVFGTPSPLLEELIVQLESEDGNKAKLMVDKLEIVNLNLAQLNPNRATLSISLNQQPDKIEEITYPMGDAGNYSLRRGGDGEYEYENDLRVAGDITYIEEENLIRIAISPRAVMRFEMAGIGLNVRLENAAKPYWKSAMPIVAVILVVEGVATAIVTYKLYWWLRKSPRVLRQDEHGKKIVDKVSESKVLSR